MLRTRATRGIPEKTWEGDLHSSSFTAGNWGPSGVPTSTDDVCVPAATPNPPVIGAAGTQADVASIESSQTLAVPAGKILKIFSTSQSSLLHNNLTLNGGTLDNAGSLTVQGNLNWGGGSSIIGAGTTTIAPAGTLTASGQNTSLALDTGTLHVDGTATFAGATGGNFFDTYLQNAAEIEIGSGGTLDLQDDQTIYDLGGGTNRIHVLAGGTLTRTQTDGPEPASVGVPVENDGTVAAVSGTTTSLAGGSNPELAASCRLRPGRFAAGTRRSSAPPSGTHSVGGCERHRRRHGPRLRLDTVARSPPPTLTVSGTYAWKRHHDLRRRDDDDHPRRHAERDRPEHARALDTGSCTSTAPRPSRARPAATSSTPTCRTPPTSTSARPARSTSKMTRRSTTSAVARTRSTSSPAATSPGAAVPVPRPSRSRSTTTAPAASACRRGHSRSPGSGATSTGQFNAATGARSTSPAAPTPPAAPASPATAPCASAREP